MANNQVNGEEAVTTSQRLPEFTAAEPELWFALVESQFRMNGILSNQERYIKVVVALPSRYTTEVRDIIKQPITADSYGTLKEQLIKRVRTSEEKKLCELLANVKIGDEKPSHYLRRLQYFAVMFFPEQLLKTMWLRSLPKKYQTVLEMQLDRSVAAMAEVADAIYSVLPTCPMVAEASISQEEQLMHQIQQFRLEVAKLKSEVSKITTPKKITIQVASTWPTST